MTSEQNPSSQLLDYSSCFCSISMQLPKQCVSLPKDKLGQGCFYPKLKRKYIPQLLVFLTFPGKRVLGQFSLDPISRL